MAIFGNIGRKISDAGQNVAQQTKNLAELTRLNHFIDVQEKKQSEKFYALGHSYYERFKDDPAAENKEIMDEISEIFKQIQITKEKIASLKGYEKCPHCNATISKDAQFCSACGQRVQNEQQNQENQLFCKRCGAKLEEESRFCIICGAEVVRAEIVQDPQTATPADIPEKADKPEDNEALEVEITDDNA